MAFTNQGWIVFAIMPIFALAGIGTPAFQALATRQVDPARQGQLQGVLASAVSLASIIGPLAFSTFYFAVQQQWPGAIWLSIVVIYAIAVPLVFLGTRTAALRSLLT
jgi:MFS transporter, DHA1 family, tetracycline resistance protein